MIYVAASIGGVGADQKMAYAEDLMVYRFTYGLVEAEGSNFHDSLSLCRILARWVR